MITAPFNFVPLSEKVFFPDWAEKVSHDIPFEDSQSGCIDITITAKSPIFIRDHKKQEEFCQHIYPNGEKQYYIPATSVKGMVRNVLEIMSFSKMSMFNDDTYAVRDLSDSKNFYMTEMKKDTFCGWLKKTDDGYVIEDCGKAGRIKHEEIDKLYDIQFASKFKKGTFGNKAKDKIAVKKYELINNENYTFPLKHIGTSTVGDKRYSYDVNSSLVGTLVLTGQPSGRDENRKIPSGKVYEFIFFKPQQTIKLHENVYKKFLFAYFDERTTEPKESEDWKYWKKELKKEEGRVPVFFQKNSEGEIEHIGLSYLYKLPYKHSVGGGIPKSHKNKNEIDLAETMFGYVEENNTLKGRIQFSHFKANDSLEKLSLKTVDVVLGTPRASYYPMYVKQIENNLYTTFMDDEFSISGWKRYPINTKIETYKLPTNKEGVVNKKVVTTFSPLKEGVVFEGKIRYHNLKNAELGALLSALTFHNTQGCFHNIGMAKSLGYGKIELKINNMEIDSYLKEFESTMNENIFDWSNQEQLEELLTMASEQKNRGNSILRYMEELKDFASNKTGYSKDFLRNYTSLENIKLVTVKSLLSDEELNIIKIVQEKNDLERIEKEKRLEEEKKLEKEKVAKEKAIEASQQAFQKELNIVLNTDNTQIIQNFIEKYPNYQKIEEIKTKKETIERAKKDNRHQEVNEKFDRAYNVLQKKKGNQNQYKKEKDKFVKKWSKSKENKGSEYILEHIDKLK